ncbi:hypothetical protein Peternella1_6 [Winogradskyella phage Peternella_1]|uniref:Uncharacterized protein n=1 Tax=Winogradskyella phage Peternella_1 TaxID=2745699 RepID=A0A8E5EC47_9CAUD|nr:hypothetical protein M1M32_gp06 [Winogradskyella phage Peternella_1]QQV91542.1 hypothetical protein Peternella1_6 [Winogradskyella phage Peternella_1]
MKNPLTELLQCSSHQLEMIMFAHFMFWCELNCKDDNELQLLIANTMLFNWWHKEYKKLQKNFLEIAEPFNSVASKREMERLYKAETIKIRDLYPKSILRVVKREKTNIIGNPQYN